MTDVVVAYDFSDLRFRKFSPSDVTELLEILRESPQAGSWSPEALKESSTSGEVWVVEKNGNVAAFVAGKAVADEFEILNLAVAVAFRRQGIARRLVSFSLFKAWESGARKAYLEVRASNEAAILLYRRLGFLECGCRQRYYQCPVEDAILLSLNLGDGLS